MDDVKLKPPDDVTLTADDITVFVSHFSETVMMLLGKVVEEEEGGLEMICSIEVPAAGNVELASVLIEVEILEFEGDFFESAQRHTRQIIS